MSGTEDFSGFEVVRAAMEVEKSGHRFYSAMVEKADSPLARELFSMLAQDEISHLRTLDNLMPKYAEASFCEGEEEFLPYLRRFKEGEIFPTEEAVAAALVCPEGDVRALELAITAEKKFSAYFYQAAQYARDDEGKKAFSWLASEEARHAEILKERKRKLTGA